MKNDKEITFNVTLPDAKQALALAQFLKRVSFTTCKQHSDPTKPDEPDEMMAGLINVQHGLMRAGFAPR